LKLGLVTYNLAKDWDVATIIEKCEANGFEGVELRTTHAHGVEVELSADERRGVKEQFENSQIELAGLGSAFDYHSADQDEVKKNIEGTREYVKLAADVGAPGVKVRPNGVQDEAGIPREKTFEQIGLALRECGEFAKDYGVKIRLEVHGRVTCDVPNIKTIMEAADHDNVYVCWNSNQGEVQDGSIKENFELVKQWIDFVHMRDICLPDYPWQELVDCLKGIGHEGFCCAEIPENPDPDRIMKYYSALWRAYTA